MRGASQAEPTFIRASVRAVTCHIRMGDFAAAETVLSSIESGPYAAEAMADVAAKRADLATVRSLADEVRVPSNPAT